MVPVLTLALQTAVICRLRHQTNHRLMPAGGVGPSRASPHLARVDLNPGCQPLVRYEEEGTDWPN